MKNKALDLVYRTHTDGKERTVFMSDFIIKHDKGDLFQNIKDTMQFFYKHIPVHFAYEEVVISALLTRSKKLSKNESVNLERILEEHRTLRSCFNNIEELSRQIPKEAMDTAAKENFTRIVQDTIIALIKHAEFEDKYLFPVADLKLDDDLLTLIENEISNIIV